MAGRIRKHYGCRNPATRNGMMIRRHGRIVNAYVRLGSPSKWTVIGEICIDCGNVINFNTNAAPRS